MIGPAIYIGVMIGVWKITAAGPMHMEENPSSDHQKISGKHVRSSSSIPGPKSLDDRIAIVGAGPSGIHMAYKLKKAGFQKVTVFESTEHIGGKSRTLYHRFTPHDMGTCNLQPDYMEISRLIEELKAGDIVSAPDPIIWVDMGATTVPLSIDQYLGVIATQMKPELAINETEMQSYIQAAVVKYSGLHISLFGMHQGRFMPRPSDIALAATNMTFMKFLRVHDIEILQPVFFLAHTAQGYGELDEISALYGMMWITPNFLTQVLLPRPPGETSIKILSKGFQTVWEEMVKQANINVLLSSPITKILRSKTCFQLSYKTCRGRRRRNFDFIILTPTMRSLRNIITFNEKERDLFLKTFNHFFTTTLIDTTYWKRLSPGPRNYFYSNMVSIQEDDIWGQRDMYSSLNFIKGDNYTSGEFPGGPDGKKLRTSVYYQFSNSRPNGRSLKRDLRRHIVRIEKAEVVKMLEQFIWPYFPRYSVSDMASGVLWDILDMQGQYGMWYLGSSVSFESVDSVVDYNNLLFQNYDVPIDV